jgi:hypothetical protein
MMPTKLHWLRLSGTAMTASPGRFEKLQQLAPSLPSQPHLASPQADDAVAGGIEL